MPKNTRARRFIEEWRANAARLQAEGLYDPAHEHDSCGVGLVAAIDGKPRRAVVEAGIAALKALRQPHLKDRRSGT